MVPLKMKLLLFVVVATTLVADVVADEERKVMRRRKVLPSTADTNADANADISVDNAAARTDESHYRVKKQMRPQASVEQVDVDVAQSRSDDSEDAPKAPIRGVKLRRKKQNPLFDQGAPANPAAPASPAKKAQRKKIPIIVPTLTSTSTTTPTPQIFIPEDGALNRTEEDSRFLSLFTVIRFKNEACKSGSGSNGTCYSSGDCASHGGQASGSCAQGFGVCCLFTRTCSESTNTNGTYFQNRAYPSTFDTVGSCQLTVDKANDNVCQLRLDFQNFMLSQPDATDNQCRYDQFIVSGGSSPVPAICGTNSGQHIYVDMGMAYNNPVTLTVVSSGSTSSTRSFSIKVTQIECSSLNRAPDGCLQYFQGVTGTLMTFNYMDAAGLQLSNTDYTQCVRSERNFCGIQYTACPDTVNVPTTTGINQATTQNYAMSFSVTGGSPSTGSIIGTNCATDWVTIPCATNTMDVNLQTGTPAVCVDRLCGMVFNSVTTPAGSPNVPINSYVKPFTVHVHTNAVEGSSTPAETKNRGFCLKYVQQPCTSTG